MRKLTLITDIGILLGIFASMVATKDPLADAIYLACSIAFVIHIERRK